MLSLFPYSADPIGPTSPTKRTLPSNPGEWSKVTDYNLVKVFYVGSNPTSPNTDQFFLII